MRAYHWLYFVHNPPKCIYGHQSPRVVSYRMHMFEYKREHMLCALHLHLILKIDLIQCMHSQPKLSLHHHAGCSAMDWVQTPLPQTLKVCASLKIARSTLSTLYYTQI